MLENNDQFNDVNMQMPEIKSNGNEIKLPSLSRQSSRLNNNRNNQKKVSILPNINVNSIKNLIHQDRNILTPRNKVNWKKKEIIAKDAEKKIKLIIAKQDLGKTIQPIDDKVQSDDDFEAKINQNLEIIKKCRENQNKISQNNQKIQKNLIKENKIHQRIAIHKKKGSLYEHRGKEITCENKHIQKQNDKNEDFKKENIRKVQNQNQDKMKQKLHQSAKRYGKFSVNNQQSNDYLKERQSLFDTIQNYLSNPKQYKQKKIKKSNTKQNMQQLQKQMQFIQEQFQQKKQMKNKNENQNKIYETEKHHHENWGRLQLKNASLGQYVESNFDKQIDWINSLQEKNDQMISGFIHHRKMLIELELLHKSCFEKKK